MNRRKARAGRSLENHLDALLTMAGLSFDHPGRTEGHSEPDFLLPSGKYFDIGWPSDRLVMLAAKTTCKDRWRQILPEADKIKTKHLCTLQQGISANQMDEMERAGVVLVVPSEYHRHYPADRRGRLLSVGQFIDFARETTDSLLAINRAIVSVSPRPSVAPSPAVLGRHRGLPLPNPLPTCV